jgi:hypothetical protein
MKFLEGNPLEQSEVRLSSIGLPKIFSPSIVSAIRSGSVGDLKIILTILNSTRALSFGKGCDTSTITEPLNKGESYDSLVKDMGNYTSSY